MQRTRPKLGAAIAALTVAVAAAPGAHTNRAVAITSGGGDPRCRSQHHPLRLDIPAARAFYDEYLRLP